MKICVQLAGKNLEDDFSDKQFEEMTKTESGSFVTYGRFMKWFSKLESKEQAPIAANQIPVYDRNQGEEIDLPEVFW
jgi:hypothetical protein|eukprot:SAG25_NODE_948_length_4622_cov_14.307981_2_plen_77_part_00